MRPSPGDIPLSLAFHTVPELSPPEMARAAAAAGFRFIGARLLHGLPGRDPAPLLGDAALRRETLAILRGEGLGALDASGARLVPETDMTAFGPFFDAAAELGVRHVLATGDDADAARLTARLAELCRRAAAQGMTVAVEFVSWMSVGGLGDAARLVRATGAANAGIAVDALHFSRSRSALHELAALPRAWFPYWQICDAPAAWDPGRDALLHEAVRERLLPGEGALDLGGIARALPLGIPVVIEIPTEALARTVPAAERLRRAVAATRRTLAAAYLP